MEYGLDLEKDPLYISLEDHKRMERAEVIPGDVVLTIAGSIGNSCVIKGIERANINQAIVKIRPSDEINSDYLAIFLNSHLGKFQTERLANGAVQLNVNFSETGDIKIIVPPLDTQRTLVADMESARLARQEKLSQADELLKGIDGFVLEQLGVKLPKEEKRSTFAVRLDAVKQGRQDALYYAPYYEKLISALDKCKHPKDSLGNISPELVGGATPSKAEADLYAEDGIKFLRILNVAPNEIILNNVNYIQDSVHNGELKRSQLAVNDVLMTITGRVGTSAVVTKDILPANINQHIVKMRIQRKDCSPEYLAIYLNSSIGTALTNRGVTGGTRIALDYEVIRKIQIPLPSLEVQKIITAELSRRRAQVRALREEAEREWQNAKEKFEKALLG